MVRYGAVLVALVLIVVGVMYYNRSQELARQEAMTKALRVDDATTGTNFQAANLHFETEADKTKAKVQAFTDLSAKYNGTEEGAIADIYLASYATDQGRLDEPRNDTNEWWTMVPRPTPVWRAFRSRKFTLRKAKAGGGRRMSASPGGDETRRSLRSGEHGRSAPI